MQLKEIAARLLEERKQHGRLTQIASATGISSRTVYSVMSGLPVSIATADKLAAYFTKLDRKAKKEKSA